MEQKLKQAGYKLTSVRKTVMHWITTHGKVFSAKELRAALPELDKVSVYRTLDLLSELDLIHQAHNLHGEMHYEVHGDVHHHHLVCTGCEKTECIPCSVGEVNMPASFTQIHHSMTYTGLCGACS